MEILKVKFQSGLTLPILLRQEPSQPAFVSFLYSILYLKNKAYSTGFNSLHLIRKLYQVAAESGSDLDELIISKKIKQIIKYADEVIFGLESDHDIGAGTRNAYLNDLLNFLRWCSTRYCNGKYNDLIQTRLETYKISASTAPNNFKSLTEADEDLLRRFCFPSSSVNPFRKNNKFRNWLIIEIFLQTGLRLGEILTLYSSDLRRLGDNFYLSINRKIDGSIDPRRRQVSERGSPLTNTALFEMIKVLNHAVRSEDKKFPSISPHTFRHTFSERFLENLIEFQGYDVERAKDIMRSYCGWSMNSPMPAFYAKRYISVKANIENINRIQNSKRTKQKCITNSRTQEK